MKFYSLNFKNDLFFFIKILHDYNSALKIKWAFLDRSVLLKFLSFESILHQN